MAYPTAKEFARAILAAIVSTGETWPEEKFFFSPLDPPTLLVPEGQHITLASVEHTFRVVTQTSPSHALLSAGSK